MLPVIASDYDESNEYTRSDGGIASDYAESHSRKWGQALADTHKSVCRKCKGLVTDELIAFIDRFTVASYC